MYLMENLRALALIVAVTLSGMPAKAQQDAATLTGEAQQLRQGGRSEEAIPRAEQALALVEKASGPQDLNVAPALNLLASLYQDTGAYAKAEPLFERALAIREKALGPDHIEVAQSLNNLANLDKAMGAFPKAEPLFVRSLAILERVAGLEHPLVALALVNLAGLYRTTGAYTKAEPLYLRAVAIREKVFGPDHPEVAAALNELATLYQEMGVYAKAEALFTRALAIREKVPGPNYLNVAVSLNNLALLYQTMGAYEKAEPLYTRSLALREKALGPDHLTVATGLNNLAGFYLVTGEYAKAEPLFVRALAIREKALGPDHALVPTSVNNLASLYEDMGVYPKAESLYLRALAIRERALGPDHPDVAASLNNLARLYHSAMGANAKAEPLYVRALAIVEKALGPEHPTVATALNNLAVLYQAMGANSKAEPLLTRALAVREKALGPDHRDVAGSLLNLAVLYQMTGAYAKAEPLYMRALTVFERALGPEHPDTVQSLNQVALFYEETGEYAKAIEYQARANDARERGLTRNLVSGSEARKLLYLQVSAGDLDRTIALHTLAAPRDARACRIALEIVLRRKGRALDAMTDAVETLRRRAAPEDAALLDQLTAARAELSRRTLAGPGAEGVEAHRAEVSRLEQRAEELEGQVAARSSQFRATSQPITLAAVQRAIPAGALLVEFASYYPYDAKKRAWGERRYVAYTLGPEGEPAWAELGEAKPIDDGIAALRGLLRSPTSDEQELRRQARSLDGRVMRPVRALAGATRRLLIVPDGALNLLPFAALVDEQGKFLVETYTLSYLTSGRDLLRLAVPRGDGGAPVVVANPDFGAKGGSAVDGVRRLVHEIEASGFAGGYFPPLAGTQQEGVAVGGLLKGARVLTGAEASKSALLAAAHPSVLHVATHGFFLDAPAQAPESGNGARQLVHEVPGADVAVDDPRAGVAAIENPLLRSGLALAGANVRSGQADDGILTALEASGLDLWGTRLVVLSACDTGVGEVKTGDGVYGLRRALVLAGSETQMMSLWPVSDAGTRDLMIGFYKSLYAGQGRSDALRRVQLAMLVDPARRHPYYWASFIQSGAWGPLSR